MHVCVCVCVCAYVCAKASIPIMLKLRGSTLMPDASPCAFLGLNSGHRLTNGCDDQCAIWSTRRRKREKRRNGPTWLSDGLRLHDEPDRVPHERVGVWAAEGVGVWLRLRTAETDWEEEAVGVGVAVGWEGVRDRHRVRVAEREDVGLAVLVGVRVQDRVGSVAVVPEGVWVRDRVGVGGALPERVSEAGDREAVPVREPEGVGDREREGLVSEGVGVSVADGGEGLGVSDGVPRGVWESVREGVRVGETGDGEEVPVDRVGDRDWDGRSERVTDRVGEGVRVAVSVPRVTEGLLGVALAGLRLAETAGGPLAVAVGVRGRVGLRERVIVGVGVGVAAAEGRKL